MGVAVCMYVPLQIGSKPFCFEAQLSCVLLKCREGRAVYVRAMYESLKSQAGQDFFRQTNRSFVAVVHQRVN